MLNLYFNNIKEDPKLAFNDRTEAEQALEHYNNGFLASQREHKNYDWTQIRNIILEGLPEAGQISTKDLLELYEQLDRRFYKEFDMPLSDACQVLINLVIKNQYVPRPIELAS